ncbi:hypothetical protein IH824_07135 [candidate division KSB1 bacterium]|nr:hypothetical protein [candidate division KSB1 bacterium]
MRSSLLTHRGSIPSGSSSIRSPYCALGRYDAGASTQHGSGTARLASGKSSVIGHVPWVVGHGSWVFWMLLANF